VGTTNIHAFEVKPVCPQHRPQHRPQHCPKHRRRLYRAPPVQSALASICSACLPSDTNLCAPLHHRPAQPTSSSSGAP
jgi:hypothetical protein